MKMYHNLYKDQTHLNVKALIKNLIGLNKFVLLVFPAFFLTCNSNTATSQTTINCSLSGIKRDLSTYRFGFNMNIAHEPSWKSINYLDIVRSLHPKIVRYPGGTVANYYDWKNQNWHDEIGERKKQQHLKSKPPVNDLPQLKKFLDYTGADLIVNLNLLSSDKDKQLDLLRKLISEGIVVKFVELGNEFYLSDSQYTKKFPTNISYYMECQTWIPDIKKIVPDAKIALVGSSVRNSDNTRRKYWNQIFTQKASQIENLTLHVYGASGIKHSPDKDPDKILRASFQRISAFRENDLAKIPTNIKLWITEFNLFERADEPIQGRWVHGLYATIMNLLLIEEERVEMTCVHALNHAEGGYRAGVILDRRLPCNGVKQTDKEFRYSATGYGMLMIGKALDKMTLQEKLNFSMETEFPDHLGYLYTSNTSLKKVLLINLSNKERKINISGILKSDFNYEQISGDPLNRICDPSQISSISSKGKDFIVVKPYSISLITNSTDN